MRVAIDRNDGPDAETVSRILYGDSQTYSMSGSMMPKSSRGQVGSTDQAMFKYEILVTVVCTSVDIEAFNR